MAEKIEMTVSNYRLIKDLQVVFETGNLYFVNAGNRQGKTSFINLIQDMFEAKASTDNTVSFGEEVGEAKMKIINFKNEEGENYVLKYEFGATDKFTLIMPNGDIKKKVTEIREVFKYQRMSVDKFFQLGLNADGRKEQSKFIKNLIPKEVSDRIVEIDKDINEKNGVLFKERGVISADIKAMQNILNDLQLNDKEKHALTVKEEFEGKSIVIKKQYDELNTKKLSSDTEALKSQRELISKQIEGTNVAVRSNTEQVREYELQIGELQKKILSLHQTNVTLVDEAKASETKLKEVDDKIADSSFTDEDNKKLEELDLSVQTRAETQKKLDALAIKYTNLLKQQESIATKNEELEAKNNKLEELRKEKKGLIAKAKLPEKLIIVDDELFYDEGNGNHIPFNEDNVSYATGGKEIIKLIAQVNEDLPIIVIGKAAEYDEQSLNELAEMAKQYNKVLVCDYVTNNEDLQVVCYQKGELNG